MNTPGLTVSQRAGGELSTHSDGDLVARIRASDRTAESALYDRYRHRVVMWVLSRTGDPYAEDYFQEAYTRIFLPAVHGNYLRDASRVERFLRTITMRLATRVHRRNREQLASGDFRWEEVAFGLGGDDVEPPEERLAREEAHLLRTILEEQCSKEERDLHRRHWVEGREIKELAREDGVGEEALRKRHSRMLIWLRQQMADGLWALVGHQVGRQDDPTQVVEHLLHVGVISREEGELLSMRYVRRRGWDVLAHQLACSEREAAEEVLALVKRVRLDL